MRETFWKLHTRVSDVFRGHRFSFYYRNRYYIMTAIVVIIRATCRPVQIKFGDF